MSMLDKAKHVVQEREQMAAATLIGFRLTALDLGIAECRMETDPRRHANPMGSIHGGILCDIADAAMGFAFVSTLEDGETFTTVEFKINYLRPVWRASLLAKAHIVKRGRTIGLAQCDITDQDDKLVARASSTSMVLRGDQGVQR